MSTIGEQVRFLRGQPSFRRRPIRTIARLAAWRARAAAGLGGTLQLNPWRISVEIPPGWHGLGKLLWAFRGTHEPELAWLLTRLRPGDVFVDVGANIGLWTLAAARAVGPEGRVIAFEPGSATADVLERNVRRNDLEQITIHRTAVADVAGTATLSIPPGADRATLGDAPAARLETVATEPLDAVLARERIDRVDAMKIDVEGAEELVLRGASSLVDLHRPLIVFEVNRRAAAAMGLRGDGAWDMLADAGYRFMTLDGGSLRPLTVPPSGIRNVIAVPSDR